VVAIIIIIIAICCRCTRAQWNREGRPIIISRTTVAKIKMAEGKCNSNNSSRQVDLNRSVTHLSNLRMIYEKHIMKIILLNVTLPIRSTHSKRIWFIDFLKYRNLSELLKHMFNSNESIYIYIMFNI
jgi:hypothetical protein